MDGRNGREERRRRGDGEGRGQWKEEKGGKGIGK